ncbi:MAG: indolepyruvate oxidoreductase subunit beta family protein [Parvibaculaceae bacterium]
MRRGVIGLLAPRPAPHPNPPPQGGREKDVRTPSTGREGTQSVLPSPSWGGEGVGGIARSTSPAPARTSVLIAAMGGEGGGLLADWIVEAARHAGLHVQSTSIPGVAQRTGATTYYIEMMPPAADGRAPVFGLYPVPGEVDIAVASELVEAGRLAENGFLTPGRTTLVSSTHRVHAIGEKTALGDGSADSSRILDAVRRFSGGAVLADFAARARTGEAALNAVLLGAMLASGRLPFGRAEADAAIRQRGVAAEANVAGVSLGLAPDTVPDAMEERADAPGGALPPAGDLPAAVAELAAIGLARLEDYQDADYAALYAARLRRIVALDRAETGHALGRETARWLALWMAYEDVIRVADLKSRPERIGAVRRDTQAKPNEPLRITEFFKPGVEEAAALLPAALGHRLIAWAERRGLRERLHVPLHLRTDSILGYLTLRLLAKLKGLRRKSLRHAQEQALIERWLGAVEKAAARDPDFALAVSGLGRLVKGYGDTRARANRNLLRILEAVVEPALASSGDLGLETQRLKRATEAALADEEGKALAAALKTTPSPSGGYALAAE